MTEILRDNVGAAFNKTLYQAENALLNDARADAFSVKGKLTTNSDGSSTLSGNFDGKTQELNATSTTQEGVDWNLTYYDQTNSIYPQGDVTSSTYRANLDVASSVIGTLATGEVQPVHGVYSASVTNADGDTRNYQGLCVTNVNNEAAVLDCNTIVKDSSGNIIYTLNETQSETRDKGILSYNSVMSDPNGNQIGSIKASMVKGDADSTYHFDASASKF